MNYLLEHVDESLTTDIRETDTHVYFWGSFLSNFHGPTNVWYDGIEWPTSEHVFMWMKAKQFNDRIAMAQLLAEPTPAGAKGIGRRVVNYDDAVWAAVRYEAMYKACFSKFYHNPTLKDALLATGDKIIVEASPMDLIWGVGLHHTNDDILDEDNWTGQNLLGKALMQVRKRLRDGHTKA